MTIIKARDISKEFVSSTWNWRSLKFDKKSKLAVDGLSVDIEEGEFVGFLGPNGAGKTTFLKALSGIIYPSSGTAKVLGYVPWERDFRYLRQMALVMGQKNQLWWDLPAVDSYKLLKEVYQIDDTRFSKNLESMVEALDMKKLLSQRLRDMSLGERMKCELVAGFLHDPRVIFLDEPTIGLDVISAQAIRNFLKKINEEKKCTVILTSHYMADVEALCPRVIVINHGHKVFDGKISSLKEKYAQTKHIEIYLETMEDKKAFAHLEVDKSLREGIGVIDAKREDFSEVAKNIFGKFDPSKISISDPSMEDVISQVFNEEKA
jgi:ABC-2 type transport system ATP-binding protein